MRNILTALAAMGALIAASAFVGLITALYGLAFACIAFSAAASIWRRA